MEIAFRPSTHVAGLTGSLLKTQLSNYKYKVGEIHRHRILVARISRTITPWQFLPQLHYLLLI